MRQRVQTFQKFFPAFFHDQTIALPISLRSVPFNNKYSLEPVYLGLLQVSTCLRRSTPFSSCTNACILFRFRPSKRPVCLSKKHIK
ncbi:hypothetical protein C8R41DRAFT_833114 [Lentinula lateritia]|uniref:Uncharacterized protein n=1 Tax=Lentinula lateritia TaxID=40482 RepID=A0ABQ8VEP9_9AGAR|nr:hypothetical protein C8R41DRAFT_833114 [Lentinula lateritia]